eukprot:2581058-Rhodomonas_salina.1
MDWQANTYVGHETVENQTDMAFMGVASIMINPGDEAPSPSKKCPFGKEDASDSQKILNP